MISSEIRVYIKERRKEFKALHLKENKNRKEAERIQTADMPYGDLGTTLRYGHIGLTPGGILPRGHSGVSIGTFESPYGKIVEPSYSTEITPMGIKVITRMGNGEEYSTFIPNEDVTKAGLTESKALDMLRGLKF